ncbi:MAG: MBL fold metallo-hydrolase [Ruminococcaceae bacterium]|nr:MBL fold metallo-hydrolase [Oscillospiraceae bacterium]
MARQYGSDRQARRRKIDRSIFAIVCGIVAMLVLVFGVDSGQYNELISGFTRACRQVTDSTAQVPDGQMIIHMIDVGQGDSVLVQTSEANILIDAGEVGKGDEVLEYLNSVGVERLNWVICTHPHSDHLGGMTAVLKEMPADNVMMPAYPESLEVYERFYLELRGILELKEIPITTAQPGAEYTFGELKMKVLWPADWQFSDDLNDWSTALRFSYGELDFLTCGDITEKAELQLLMSGAAVEAEIIKSSHHGSSYSSCEEFLSAAAPELALISCGKGNSYQHPHDNLLKRYRQHDIKWKRTDVCGNIRVICENGEYTIKTQK